MKAILTATAASLAFTATAYGAPLTIEVNGVQGDGPLYVSVQTEEQFMQDEGVEGSIVQSPEPGTHSFTYDLPEGQYAVSVWHDDGNGTFDRAESGWPLDGWAMSGELGDGPPSFEDVAVDLRGQGADVSLDVHYPQ
ncbi:DUF2141 domain-containing protein [Marinicauda sp. Alg238-R41]|jgi:uncharacterized protein (DUF2141 family)|uniref:DUF2141 domain-containing protein n=1 Tax=Marinicauda sp. Alg238-R41 TaxID=2993447 RepID=UPI0022E2338B|nr:DUF2141 domain-containing protein [Marinicauda sp. Alg238-R41]